MYSFPRHWYFATEGTRKLAELEATSNWFYIVLNHLWSAFAFVSTNLPSSKAGSSVKQGLRVGESLFQKELNTMFDYTDYQPYLYICKIPLSLSRGRVNRRVRLAPFLSSSQAKVLHQRWNREFLNYDNRAIVILTLLLELIPNCLSRDIYQKPYISTIVGFFCKL